MPQVPPTDGEFDFLDRPRDRVVGVGRNFVQALNLTDMFLGKEKQDVFHLIPGEEVLDEFIIRHQHFLIVQSGMTRVTLTTHRLLYTLTRVFSPAYWLLVVLFPPLMLYYVFRISLNRNVAMPLSSIDSVEKKYRPNWVLFVVATLAVYLLAGLCTLAITGAFEDGKVNLVLVWTVRSIVLGLAAPVVLVILLKTRIVALEVRSANSKSSVPVQFSAGDVGFSETRFDAFVQQLCAEVHRAKTSVEQQESSPL